MTRTRWFDLGAVVLAVVVVVGMGFALRTEGTAALAVGPATVSVDREPPPSPTRPSALFIGDSFTAGNGLPEMSYACRAAVQMGWLCRLSAVPGTGYISGGPANRFIVDPYTGPSTSFVERIPHLAIQYQPDFVVLDGGRNDLFPPREDVFMAMAATIQQARQAWPTATIVFIRPRLLEKPSDDLGFDDGFMRRLKATPTATGVVFIDPLDKLAIVDTSDMLKDDDIHPNRLGEQQLSVVLFEALSDQKFAEKN